MTYFPYGSFAMGAAMLAMEEENEQRRKRRRRIRLTAKGDCVMEDMLSQYVGKEVEITGDGIYEKGVVMEVNATAVKVKDKKDVLHIVNLDYISQVNIK